MARCPWTTRWMLALGGAMLPLVASAQEGTGSARERPPIARAVQEIEALDALRSSLARTFAAGGVAATDSTFAQVCKPVKGEAMRVAKETGWSIAQLAERNRNTDNALDVEARRAFQQLQRDPALLSVTRRTTYKGVAGMRYLRRITVEPACLACHGARDQRPAFVRRNYPADKAYGFAAGDLRGVYSVFIPDSVGRR